MKFGHTYFNDQKRLTKKNIAEKSFEVGKIDGASKFSGSFAYRKSKEYREHGESPPSTSSISHFT